ncbi:hypothetical protein F4780DRAFT_796732 [Xylariomycetidae sp. FL0641]|nr:hypothetical protein F4780DRAFT_796732 [Xylariomycetidae sp. FL0641]
MAPNYTHPPCKCSTRQPSPLSKLLRTLHGRPSAPTPPRRRPSGKCSTCGAAPQRGCLVLDHPLRMHAPYHAAAEEQQYPQRLALNRVVSLHSSGSDEEGDEELSFEGEKAVADRVYAYLALHGSPVLEEIGGRRACARTDLQAPWVEGVRGVVEEQISFQRRLERMGDGSW